MCEMATSSPVVTQARPHFEPSDRMLDPGTSTAMTAPRRITHDAASAEDRRHELWNATIATVGEDAPVQLTRLDLRTTVVDCIVAIARTAGGSRDDLEITMTDQHLCVAGVTVVLRLRRMRMIPCRNQRAVDDPRAAPVTAGDVVEEYGEPGRDRRDDPVRSGLRDLEHDG